MSTALKVSSDVYFFNLGLHATASGNGGQIQDWAFKYGLGRKPDVDIPDATAGLIPTPAWREPRLPQPLEPVHRPALEPGRQRQPRGRAGRRDGHAAAARPGLCRARQRRRRWSGRTSAGGIVDVHGRTVERIKPPPKRHLHISPRDAERDPRRHAPGRRRAGRHLRCGDGQLPHPGRRQDRHGPARQGQQDQSWYGVIAPYDNPQIVVTVTVERGGFGVESAAPIARDDPRALLQPARSAASTRPAAARPRGRADGSRQALAHDRPAPLAARRVAQPAPDGRRACSAPRSG